MKKLPKEFVVRMRSLLGDEYAQYEQSINNSPVRAFRVNTDKISVEAFEKICDIPCERIPYVENGYYFNYDKIGNHPFHHAGMIYVQEPGAMAPAECIEFQKDWKVLDMCAAPGGKSTQIKNKLGKNGVLVSNEIISSRCKVLTGNVERLGLHNTVTTCMESTKIAQLYPAEFDMIMVDAPCSGEGMFRKDDTAINEWSTDNVTLCADRQAEILDNAVKALKNGGYIIYATCTFSLEENEMTVDSFLQRHPNFELVPVCKKVEKATSDGIYFDGCQCENIRYSRRFYPHKARGEGQFMAVLRNTLPADCTNGTLKNHNEKVDGSVFDYLDDTLTEYRKENVRMYNGKPVYFTPDFNVVKGSAFSCGITIGEIRNNYIRPHHQFFMAMGKNFKRKIDFNADSDEIKRYLHGEEIPVSCDNGWAVITVNGCAVGGVKVSNGKAKNQYPKGLRTMY